MGAVANIALRHINAGEVLAVVDELKVTAARKGAKKGVKMK